MLNAQASIAPLAEKLDGHFYYHGTTRSLLELGHEDDARVVSDRAIPLGNIPPVGGAPRPSNKPYFNGSSASSSPSL
jgi:hypothetical protein